MPSDAWSPSPIPAHKSLESLKQNFKLKLDAILDKQLTPDNIEKFGDEALSETIELTQEILTEYRKNPNVHARPNTLSGAEEEDEAFSILGLENITNVLENINSVRDRIEALKKYIHTGLEKTDTVITPPQTNHRTEITGGDGSFEKKMFPRLLTLAYILEHDFDIPPTEMKITEGAVKPEMMRKTPYVRVEISSLERAVYICEEEGNTSYIFDTKRLADVGLKIEEVDLDDKRDKNSLIAYYPGIGIRIRQTSNWRSRVTNALGEPIPEIQTNVREEHEEKERERISEFRERKVWLPWEDFQREVMNIYPGRSDIVEWYREEQRNHHNWPKSPYAVYKNKGWLGFPELVGRENRFKKVFLPFDRFTQEVRSLYPGGDIQKWYKEERKNHPNWPSLPSEIYKDNGWITWTNLVGKEPIKFLSFVDLQKEILILYSGQGDIKAWYKEERENHPNWPSSPGEVYKHEGWLSWPELIGKENRLKKQYPPFSDFQAEVRALYPGYGDVSKWYDTERKNHPNWHASPDRYYKNKGWQGFADLVGKESHLKKEYLLYADFQAEVRALYPGYGGVREWYLLEKKNHKNWPHHPSKIYIGHGWIDWPELVDRENRLKKEYLNFDNFQREVKDLYPGEGDVIKWYRDEYQKHPNWPSHPERIYEDNWVGWPELVGKENRRNKS